MQLSQVYEKVIDVVFPPRCAGCDEFNNELFCEKCALKIRLIHSPFCLRCALPFDPLAKDVTLCRECRPTRYHQKKYFQKLRCLYSFEGPIREAVHHLKYERQTALAKPLANLLKDYINENCWQELPAPNFDLVTDVPLHWWRQYRRGYNQSTLLAQEFSKISGINYQSLLLRNKPTQSQMELNRAQRLENLKGVFHLKDKSTSLKDKTILLLDDVCTTGATLNECSRALVQTGATVYALTLARQLVQHK